MHEPDIAPRAPWLGRTTPKSDGEADGSPVAYLRWVGAALMAAHGLVHLMSMQLLWKLDQPGQLTYSAAEPVPGTTAAYAVGALFLLAALVFVAASLLMVSGRVVWRAVALVGVMISAAVIAIQPSQVRAGLVMDGIIVVSVAWAVWTERRRLNRPAASED